MYRRSQRWKPIINNRFLSLYDYNFLLVIGKIFSVNSTWCPLFYFLFHSYELLSVIRSSWHGFGHWDNVGKDFMSVFSIVSWLLREFISLLPSSWISNALCHCVFLVMELTLDNRSLSLGNQGFHFTVKTNGHSLEDSGI